MHKIFLLLMVSFALTGCSQKSLYQTGKSYQKTECIKHAQTAEDHMACNNAKEKTFEEYERERKSVIKKEQ